MIFVLYKEEYYLTNSRMISICPVLPKSLSAKSITGRLELIELVSAKILVFSDFINGTDSIKSNFESSLVPMLRLILGNKFSIIFTVILSIAKLLGMLISKILLVPFSNITFSLRVHISFLTLFCCSTCSHLKHQRTQ